MATGAAWNDATAGSDEVVKPWAFFDAHDVIDIPLEIGLWLTDKETTYASHAVTTHADLSCTNPAAGYDSGTKVIKSRIIKAPAGAALVNNTKYWVTFHVVGADGQEKDRTVYLKAALM